MATENHHGCAECGGVFMPWVTTCPRCAAPLDNGAGPTLADQPAPQTPPARQWIDIEISSEKPVEAALLRHFLIENGFEVEESRRFISVPADRHTELLDAVQVWAFSGDLLDDERQIDSLGSTLRELGYRVHHAVQTHRMRAGSLGTMEVSLDLR